MAYCDKVCFALRAAALALLVIAVGCDRDKDSLPSGQKEQPKALSGRYDDKEYLNRLKSLQGDQKKIARERNDIERKMELERKRAQAALGAKATGEQVLAELEANPVKYPQWKYLVGRLKAVEGEMGERRAKARAEVVARIAREQRERDAAGVAASSPNGVVK